MSPQRPSFLSRGLLALAVLALIGCADREDLTGPVDTSIPSHAGGDGWVAERGHIDLCVHHSSPAGTYLFNRTVDGGSAASYSVAAGQCVRVWSRSAPGGSPVDPPATVVITQVNQPLAATYLGVGHVDGSAPHTINVPGRTITYQANYWHGAVAAYLSGRGQGCVPEQWNVTAGRWAATGISANQSFNAYFGIPVLDPDLTFDQALRLGTSPPQHQFARHAAAAVMNAQHSGVAYTLSLGQIRAIVRAVHMGAVPIDGAAETLSHANHLGCPL